MRSHFGGRGISTIEKDQEMESQVYQLEALRGVDSLQVVLHRFSDGVEVVKCVLEFCKEVGEVEQNYSNSIHKLLQSSSYSFHSNILMKWLGSAPYQEIGTVRRSWQNLGAELSKLADLHSQKATAYLEAVRQPLQELLPQLEETRQELKNKIQTLRADLEAASQRHTKERQKYVQFGDSCQKLQEKTDARSKQKLLVMEGELKQLESIYRDAHTRLVDTHKQFDDEVQTLYKRVQDKELERVNTLKTSLQQFTKTMSNTAPAYLEGFQRIVMSVDEISGPDDIKHFVNDHKDLTVSPTLPEFERHPFITGEAVIPFTDTSPTSSVTVKSSAANAAKKLLSRFNFRENKSASPESSETSIEADRHEPMIMSNEESDPVIKEGSVGMDTKTLDLAGDGHLSKSEKSANATSPTSVKELEKENKPPEKVTETSNSLESLSAKAATSRRQQHSGGQVEAVNNRLKKPTVKVKPQIAVANSWTGQQVLSPSGDDKTKKELSSVEPAAKSRSSSSSSSSTGHVSSVKQKIESSSRASHQAAAVIDERATSRPNPVRHDNSIPGPVKPRPQRRTAPSSHSLQVPRPLSIPNMNSSFSPTDVSLSLPGLPDCSREELQLLEELKQKAAANDFYGLLGVDTEASVDELARARREKTRVLHPDHFANDPERQAKVQEKLARINQVFQDALRNEETRRHYDQLCRFRLFYSKILQQKTSALETALGKLVSLHKVMKKAQMPLDLLDELLLVQRLIRMRIKHLSSKP